MTALENLWYGNYEFTTCFAEGNKEYFAAAKEVVRLEESLRRDAREESRKILDELGEKQLTLCAVGEKTAFICGVRFGVRFLLDALGDSA